jgi:hypothetical protein
MIFLMVDLGTTVYKGVLGTTFWMMVVGDGQCQVDKFHFADRIANY